MKPELSELIEIRTGIEKTAGRYEYFSRLAVFSIALVIVLLIASIGALYGYVYTGRITGHTIYFFVSANNMMVFGSMVALLLLLLVLVQRAIHFEKLLMKLFLSARTRLGQLRYDLNAEGVGPEDRERAAAEFAALDSLFKKYQNLF